ncbi:MAG: SdrD B-like domain-containing protein [Kiritimatiellia bacterium]
MTLSDNTDDHSVDPVVVPASIGGTVWHDANRNATNDLGEAGIESVRIDLYEDVPTGTASSMPAMNGWTSVKPMKTAPTSSAG